jgi:hypothetical protein
MRSGILLFVTTVSAGAFAIACGSVKSTDGSGTNGGSSNDGGAGATNADGAVGTGGWDAGGGNTTDASSGPSGPPNATCPAQYSVYGDQDASDNLGAVNPTLVASASCAATFEQMAGLDGGYGATDFTMTFMQSSARSGMFMATIHQTTPFPYDLSVCLIPDGPGTGSKATSAGANDGTMILTNVPEDYQPWGAAPKVVYDTNFGASPQPDFLTVTLDQDGGTFDLGSVKCTFTKN